MSTNELKPIVISKNGLLLNKQYLDVLTQSIIEHKIENGRYPEEVIFNEEMAHRYFDYFVNGKSYTISFDKKPITFVVNIRLRASSLIMR